MNCCQNPKITDLSQGLGDERNYYCKSCKSHFYKGKVYTEKEWDDWIEDWDYKNMKPKSTPDNITESAVAAAVGGEENKSTTE